jgi:glycosyltransferase involved in cell wall biosynthesis
MSKDSLPDRLSVGVIIPTRNRAGMLRNTLEALTRQARAPDEVIVVDNGSADDTRQVIEQFNGRLPVRYFYEPIPGAGQARNLGIRHATSEILAFTDDDCIPDEDWLRFIELSFLRDPSIGMVAGKVTAKLDGETWVEKFAAVNHLLSEGAMP